MVSPSAKVNAGDTYSLLVGCVFVFNLILGTGALAMPHVFANAGWLMGLVIITVLCFMSFVQLTFLVESLANANFAKQMDNHIERAKENDKMGKEGEQPISEKSKQDSLPEVKESLKTTNETVDKENSTSEKSKPGEVVAIGQKGLDNSELAKKETVASTTQQSSTKSDTSKQEIMDIKDYFEINEKFELGNMTEKFLYPWMSFLFFVTILAYMYGDLVIYNTMMTKSLREVSCTYEYSCNATSQPNERCWGNWDLSRRDVYRLMLMVLMVVLIPLTYAGLTKTKFIQIVTIILRWIATICMIGIAIHVIAVTKNPASPKLGSLQGFPRMFGICVYAFMCHHSVPSMLTPIDRKKYMKCGLMLVYGLVLICYYFITMTGIFAFEKIDDVYTLNFVMNQCKTDNSTANNEANIPVLNIFLPSYPVFTIFSSYTVIALTLVNNLKIVLNNWTDADQPALKYTYPLIAIVPPLIVSVFTENVALIVSLVGAYTGSLIQYVFPSLLAHYSRKMVMSKYLEPYHKKLTKIESVGEKTKEVTAEAENVSMLHTEQLYFETNPFASPFQHRYWIYGTGVWWVFSVIMVTVDQIMKLLPKTEKKG